MEQFGWTDDPAYEGYVAQVNASFSAYEEAMAASGLS